MSDATVLAEALVEAGIGRKDEIGYYVTEHGGFVGNNPEALITDWRVAGKVQTIMADNGAVTIQRNTTEDWLVTWQKGYGQKRRSYHGVDTDLATAINKAWHEATEPGESDMRIRREGCSKAHGDIDPLERCTCGFSWPK